MKKIVIILSNVYCIYAVVILCNLVNWYKRFKNDSLFDLIKKLILSKFIE